MAPPATRVPVLMGDLFNYVANSKDLMLIRSSVFHYEFEFIHPFSDGNGRMGRFWQTVLLNSQNSVFGYVPFESVIHERQEGYYEALRYCGQVGESTAFIEFMLSAVEKSLERMLDVYEHQPNRVERMLAFKSYWDKEIFRRKDYMSYYKTISTATATNDLRKSTDDEMLERIGANITTTYRFK
jgi:Fic family protein